MFTWLNSPPAWSGDARRLEVTTGAETDFWQTTFYGFQRDSGHAYLQPVSGDFTLSARVKGEYEALYDQAGLMLCLDERNWIKTGIEYTDGMMHFSVVVTREVSDWSVIPLPEAISARRTQSAADPPWRRRAGSNTRSARWMADGPACTVFGCGCARWRHGLLAAARRLSRGL